VFVGWSGISTGDLLATTNPGTVTMTADTTVRARFASPVPLAEGMVAFWRGESDATDLIGGHSGTFFTGTTPTAPSITVWGKVGSAFAFTGTNYVRVPDAPGLQPPQITLEAWVFLTVLSSTSYQTVIGRGSSTAVSEQWWLGVLNGIPQFFTHSSVLLKGPTAIPLNAWTHLAATFDGATKVLYVNGIPVGSQGGLGALAYAPVPVGIGTTWQDNAPTDLFNGVQVTSGATTLGPGYDTRPLFLGRDNENGKQTNFLQGLIDEASLYNRALAAAEIASIYNAGPAGKA
jgi:hypothetical protein